MTIVIQQEFQGATLEQYERALDRLRLNGRTYKGEVFFACGKSSNGVRAIGVWESKEAYDSFVKEKLEAVLKAEDCPLPKITTWTADRAATPTGPALMAKSREQLTH